MLAGGWKMIAMRSRWKKRLRPEKYNKKFDARAQSSSAVEDSLAWLRGGVSRDEKLSWIHGPSNKWENIVHFEAKNFVRDVHAYQVSVLLQPNCGKTFPFFSCVPLEQRFLTGGSWTPGSTKQDFRGSEKRFSKMRPLTRLTISDDAPIYSSAHYNVEYRFSSLL